MGVKISGALFSGYSTTTRHESGSEVSTTAPKDNGGDGSLFSPTDLLVAAYGSCAATTMALVARRENISLESISWELEKNMVSDPDRRIGSITGTIAITMAGDEQNFKRLANIAKTCPVALSLAPSLSINVAVMLVS